MRDRIALINWPHLAAALKPRRPQPLGSTNVSGSGGYVGFVDGVVFVGMFSDAICILAKMHSSLPETDARS